AERVAVAGIAEPRRPRGVQERPHVGAERSAVEGELQVVHHEGDGRELLSREAREDVRTLGPLITAGRSLQIQRREMLPQELAAFLIGIESPSVESVSARNPEADLEADQDSPPRAALRSVGRGARDELDLVLLLAPSARAAGCRELEGLHARGLARNTVAP